MSHIYDRGGIRFAIWVGPGRDPQVAYLDARQLVITTSELGTTGLLLHGSGSSYNVLGGQRDGDVDPAVLHRIAHGAIGRDGMASFHLEAHCAAPAIDALCEIARVEPLPGTETAPLGSLALEPEYFVAWVAWTDLLRDGLLRRAVYLDGRYLLEAGVGPHGAVRAWPASGLASFGLELVAPPARDLAEIEARISRVTAQP